MKPAHILIVTNGQLCRNPRVVKEADTLGRAGYAVTVLGVRNHAASDELDRTLISGAPYTWVPIDAQRHAGWRGFRRQVAGWAARHATRRLGWQTLRALDPFGSLLRAARKLPADLTIVHNEVPHGVGLRLQAGGRTVAADIEDWHSEDLLPEDRVHRPLALLRRQEKALLANLVHTTTTSAALADALHQRFGGTRPHVISNSFPLQPDPRSANEARPDSPAFFWFSQTLGPGRGLESFLAAWSLTRTPSRVVFLGQPHPAYREALAASVPATHRASLSFRDWISPGDLPRLIAQHDIGLALEQASIPNRNLTITNKIIQYLNAGLAVVASDTAGQREVLAQNPDAGVMVNPRQTIVFASVLEGLLSDRAVLVRKQRAARRLAEEVYCWEREAPRLRALVAQALRVPTAR